MFVEQNKRERLKFVCNLLNIAGWGCLIFWLFTLPSFLPGTVKEAIEAKEKIEAMNERQGYLYEKTGKFVDSLEELGIPFPLGGNYDYLIKVGDRGVKNIAIPRKKNLKAFVGEVLIDKDKNGYISISRTPVSEEWGLKINKIKVP